MKILLYDCRGCQWNSRILVNSDEECWSHCWYDSSTIFSSPMPSVPNWSGKLIGPLEHCSQACLSLLENISSFQIFHVSGMEEKNFRPDILFNWKLFLVLNFLQMGREVSRRLHSCDTSVVYLLSLVSEMFCISSRSVKTFITLPIIFHCSLLCTQ